MITETDIRNTIKEVKISMDHESRDEWLQRNEIDEIALRDLALGSPDPTAFLAGFNFGFELAKMTTLREAEAQTPLEDL